MSTLALGICTARSTVYVSPSFGFTDSLFAQLPTTVILAGGWNATFQLVSSVGRGMGYGMATPALSRERDAVSGCWGATAGIDEIVSWSARRKDSRIGRSNFGRTVGINESIYTMAGVKRDVSPDGCAHLQLEGTRLVQFRGFFHLSQLVASGNLHRFAP